MKVDQLLDSIDLEAPHVDTEAALARTVSRGRTRRRLRALGGVCLAVMVLGGTTLAVTAARDDRSRVDVRPSEEPAPTEPVPPGPEPGDAATWVIDDAAPPSPEASTFAALVSRLGCSGGKTGRVLRPAVALDETEVVVTFTVETLPPGAYPCPGNDQVSFEVHLGEPLGDRVLLDGSCNGEASQTSFCEGGGVRWPRDRS